MPIVSPGSKSKKLHTLPLDAVNYSIIVKFAFRPPNFGLELACRERMVLQLHIH